jgi:uncharacterized protein YdeI (YjbR/CyaY-like superfamily)
MKAEYQTVEFNKATEWQKWLAAHHANTDGVWLRFYKKGSGVKTLTYAEALDSALCYGWIDGQAKKYDELSYVQKFTPRRARSMWSKRNIDHVARLNDAGLMKPAGLAEVERAKADGRWQAAYDSPKNMVIPEDFLMAVKQNKKALSFFETLGKTSRYSIGMRLQTAKKPETRARRFALLLEMLAKHEKPQ